MEKTHSLALLFVLSMIYVCYADDEYMDTVVSASLQGNDRLRRDTADILKALTTLRVATLPSAPYVYYMDNEKLKGNDQFTGFVPDLMEKLSRRVGFSYEFYMPDDRKYGTASTVNNETTWSGLIGEVLKSQDDDNKTPGKKYADIAAVDMTITKARSEVVDFIHPFDNVVLTAVIQKPHRKNLPANASAEEEEEYFNLNFDIFKPLSAGVWIMVTVLFIVVWLFTWMMNLYNPYEFGERYKRNLATEDESRLFNISGSLWYTFTILQWQGYDRAPRSIAGKMLGCIWMAFVTLTLVTYIGSLVNYLFWSSMVHGTRDPLVVPIKNLRDLVNQHDGYTYGTIRGGSTHAYITKVARGAEFKAMRDYWEGDGANQLVNSTAQGIEKVRKEKFAMILESSQAEFHASKPPCDIMMVSGIQFARRNFGMALSKQSPIREILHQEMLEMNELGIIEALERRWFSDKACWNVTTIEETVSTASTLEVNEPKRVSVGMFWSPLVVMILGVILSFIVAVAEIFWYKYRGRYDSSNRQRGHQLTNEDDGHI